MNDPGSRYGFIIQARAGSTRLPSKMLMKFSDHRTLIEIVVGTIQEVAKERDIPVMVATTTSRGDDALVALLGEKFPSLNIFRGEEEDVMKRFIDCASENNLDRIIRVCGDNPFVDPSLLLRLLDADDASKPDYCSYQIRGIPAIRTHFGFFTEIVSRKCLERIWSTSLEKVYKEHVTNYIYIHPAVFAISWVLLPGLDGEVDHIRTTIDTSLDFETSCRIYTALKDMKKEVTYKNVISYIKDDPFMLEQMTTEIAKNGK
jgi:spore coat polysaccharide biosynthesis protein SpsF (cytidylyltransferase family)